jgi:hypothetical protein
LMSQSLWLLPGFPNSCKNSLSRVTHSVTHNPQK